MSISADEFVSISSLQRTTNPLLKNDVVCVLKNNSPAFYTIKPWRYAQLLRAEKELKDIYSKLNSK